MQRTGFRGLAVRNGFISRAADTCDRLLIVTGLAVLPLLSFHPPAASALPNNGRGLQIAEKTPQVRKSPARNGPASCRFVGDTLEYRLPDKTVKRFEGLLDDGERVLDMACHKRYGFILTNTNLIMVPGKEEKGKDELSRSSSYTRKDIREWHKRGLVSWAQADDRAYLLTRDGKIADIPVYKQGKTIQEYSIPYGMGSAATVFHSGFLFIAPAMSQETRSNVMVVLKLSGEARFGDLALPDGMKNADFFFRGGRLFFGNGDAGALEVKANGQAPSDVRLVRKQEK